MRIGKHGVLVLSRAHDEMILAWLRARDDGRSIRDIAREWGVEAGSVARSTNNVWRAKA